MGRGPLQLMRSSALVSYGLLLLPLSVLTDDCGIMQQFEQHAGRTYALMGEVVMVLTFITADLIEYVKVFSLFIFLNFSQQMSSSFILREFWAWIWGKLHRSLQGFLQLQFSFLKF